MDLTIIEELTNIIGLDPKELAPYFFFMLIIASIGYITYYFYDYSKNNKD